MNYLLLLRYNANTVPLKIVRKLHGIEGLKVQSVVGVQLLGYPAGPGPQATPLQNTGYVRFPLQIPEI